MEEQSGGSGDSFGFVYDIDKWKIKEFQTMENAYALCEFIGNFLLQFLISLYTIWLFSSTDRDIQCDFNNQFWEVTDCNWVQDEVQVETFGLGDNFDKKFTRVLATTEHKAGNYWERETSLTGKFEINYWLKREKHSNENILLDRKLFPSWD